MPRYALLISPRADAAYFAQVMDVALAELSLFAPAVEVTAESFGDLRFLTVEADPSKLQSLLRLSFVQGVFEVDGQALTPISASPAFNLHPDFVWGEKYRGKTNETLTQLLLNLALSVNPDASTLCDPMCGRGTTLLWAMRYGLKATGIEQDPQALQDIQRGLKKWTKLHRQKHNLTQGWVNKSNKMGIGRYLDFSAEGSSLRAITGDTTDAPALLQKRKFDILATDIPYGVQHMGSKSARSPLETLEAAADGWISCLKPGGVMAIAFNAYIPKRAELLDIYARRGLKEVSTNVAHRMSESILRDVALLQRPAT